MVTPIMCPHCFAVHEADTLMSTTPYEVWSGEECQAKCPRCSKIFTVFCDFAGWDAKDQFDMNTFYRAHNVEVNWRLRSFTDYFFERAVEGRELKRVIVDEEDMKPYDTKELQGLWDEALEIARKEWERISGNKE